MDAWGEQALFLCETVFQAVTDCAERVAAKHFLRFQGLRMHVMQRCNEKFERQRERSVLRIKEFIAFELDPFTLDEGFMKHVLQLRSEALAEDELSEKFREYLVPHGDENLDSDNMSKITATLAKAAKEGLLSTDWDAATEVSFALKAYFPVAVTRFVDHICMLLCTELITDALSELSSTLVGEILSEDAYTIMFSVPLEEATRRKDLVAKTKRLREAANELSSLQIASI